MYRVVYSFHKNKSASSKALTKIKKIFENAFYFILAIIGVFLWKNNLDDENLVEPKKMDFKGLLTLLFSISITSTPFQCI